MESSSCMMSGLLWSVQPEIHFSMSWFLGLPLCWLTAKERKTVLLHGKLSLICSCNSWLIHWHWFPLLVFQQSQSKKFFIASSMYEILYWHSEGYRDEGKKYLLHERKRKKSLFLLGSGSMTSTMSQEFRSIILSPNSHIRSVYCYILWMRKLRLNQTGHWFES